MQGLRRLAKAFYLVTQVLGSLGLIGLMLVIGGTVVYRWFGGTFQGSYEVSEVFTIVTITLAIFMATVNRSHVDVRITYDLMPRPAQRLAMIAMGLVAVAFWAIVAWATWRLAAQRSHQGEISMVMKINMVPFRWLTVGGFIAVTLVVAWQTLMWILGREDDSPGGHHSKGDGPTVAPENRDVA